jgi:DNA-binding HxlR family transcriptional regulator
VEDIGFLSGKLCFEIRSSGRAKRTASIIEAQPPMPTPAPGRPVRGSRTGEPIMALLDLLGRRWALRVVWELRGEPMSFRELQAACGDISSSVLNDRLAELREAGIVETRDGFGLTTEGRKLIDAYRPLDAWARRWARRTARLGLDTPSGVS